MKTHFLSLLTIVSLALPRLCSAADSRADTQWQSLFNGNDLTGWVSMNEGVFSVTNGCIHLSKGMGWLRTEGQYTNFIFEADWRSLQTNYNSGFFLRAGLEGKPFPVNVWQVNLKETSLGSLLKGSPTLLQSKTPRKPVNEWNTFRMEARGSNLTLYVNGDHTWDFPGFDATSGYLGLQAEGKSFDFRNLRVKRLP